MPRLPSPPILPCLLLLAGLLLPATALAQRLAPAAATGAGPAPAAQDFSAAERLLFMHNHLAGLQPPLRLGYRFRRSGSLAPGFDDRVTLLLTPRSDGRCCATHTDFLSDARRLQLPDLPAAEGNPVLLHFLERELREMQALTKGSQSHFRKRIRMAAFDGATVQPVQLRWQGRTVAGQEVRFSPYLNDPNRPRYPQLARKQFSILLSDAVPVGVVAIRTLVPGSEDSSTPLLAEELLADGAEATTPPGSPR